MDLPDLPEEYDGIPTYVVGGWVRDQFRDGVEPNDVDLMVCEVTPNEMRRRGFTPIDNDTDTFPVFVDSLGREVAIAREEQKVEDASDNPYKAFEAEAVPASVDAEDALERDLVRRDFTTNSMAVDARTGELYDPHGGHADLQRGIIRHVSDEHFGEDPLRVLRGARFAARLDANLAPETRDLMSEVGGEVTHLPQERVRMEMEKALVQGDPPSVFFRTLKDIPVGNTLNMLDLTFPLLRNLDYVPAGPDEYHEEGSAFEHTMLALDEMNDLRPNDEIALLMALVHDYGKQVTPQDDWPNHYGHDEEGIQVIEMMNKRLKFSNEQMRPMLEASRHHMKMHDMDEMRSATVFDLRNRLTHPDRMIDLAVADKRGRRPQDDYDTALARTRFDAASAACDRFSGSDLIEQGHDPEEIGGEKFGKMVRDKRIAIMKGIESEELSE